MNILRNKKKTVWAQLIVFIIAQTFICLNLSWAFSEGYVHQPESFDKATLSPHLEINTIHSAFFEKLMLTYGPQETKNLVLETGRPDFKTSETLTFSQILTNFVSGIFKPRNPEVRNLITIAIFVIAIISNINCASWDFYMHGSGRCPTIRMARSVSENWSTEESIQKFWSIDDVYQQAAAEKIIKEGSLSDWTNEQLIEGFYSITIDKWKEPVLNDMLIVVLKMITSEVYARNDNNLNEKVRKELVLAYINDLDYADPDEAKSSEAFQKIVIIGKIAVPVLMKNFTERVGTTDTQKWSVYLVGVVGDFETAYKFLNTIIRAKDKYAGWITSEAGNGLTKLSKRYPKEFQQEIEENKTKKNSAAISTLVFAIPIKHRIILIPPDLIKQAI
ncbi:MAG: hypothetical protein KAS13_06530 [Candidatus Omnitrophica bacterium]|nr:hypothetical protein [Candidatus Omnitrophota bacterium]